MVWTHNILGELDRVLVEGLKQVLLVDKAELGAVTIISEGLKSGDKPRTTQWK
jgi:hypothetical protein